MQKDNYTNRIKAYLHLLGGFDEIRIKELEDELLNLLQECGLSPYRYRRYKTDRDNSTPIYHKEADLLFRFFSQKFDEAINIEKDTVVKGTLVQWKPTQSKDLFWETEAVSAS